MGKFLRVLLIIGKVLLALAGLVISGLIIYVFVAGGKAIVDAFRDFFHIT